MTSELSNRHPSYQAAHEDWMLMRDCYKGQRAVKARETRYLPATSGQEADGMGTGQAGYRSYRAYVTRAVFHNFVREAVQIAVGMMHSHPPQIKLPAELAEIRSSKGETMDELLRRINVEQLLMGRVGILADIPTRSLDPMPYLATYTAEKIINWDDGTTQELVPQSLNLVVLEESENTRHRNNFGWEVQERYRVLSIGGIQENEIEGIYRFGVFNDQTGLEFSESLMRTASIRGQTLNKIPFVIINSCDLIPEVDEPPLLNLANLCIAVYRAEADHRQNLFMQGQDTLVMIGGLDDEDTPVRTGAGSRIQMPLGGDAKYIGVTSDGLSEQREALEADKLRAGSMGAQSLDTVSRERESGSSLHIRIAARTADLKQIAMAGAGGLEKILKIAAEWVGANPEEVSVVPNLEFGNAILTGQSMTEMQNARNLGFPISAESLHRLAFEKGVTKLTFEEEQARAKAEETSIFKKAETGDRNPQQVAEGNSGNK